MNNTCAAWLAKMAELLDSGELDELDLDRMTRRLDVHPAPAPDDAIQGLLTALGQDAHAGVFQLTVCRSVDWCDPGPEYELWIGTPALTALGHWRRPDGAGPETRMLAGWNKDGWPAVFTPDLLPGQRRTFYHYDPNDVHLGIRGQDGEG